MLKLHYRLGHPSFHKMRVMAKQGVIPKKFDTCGIPVCAACTYAKIVKKPWQNKKVINYQANHATEIGQVVSVDQMVSPTPGLIAQVTGKLTTKRYRYATIFVDQYSKMGYAHMQKTSSAEETLEGKRIFESKLSAKGVKVKAYQADNGIFRANAWIQACKDNNQNLTFTGVNAHHQNGHTEKRIRDLQDIARTMILHASRDWLACGTANLWPYAVRMAWDIYNNSPHKGLPENKTPNQVISRSGVNMNIKHIHTFGCPVYVLSSELQQNEPYGKWKQRAQVGIYLGPSPHHNRNVALVLNRTTGLVSPQFHVVFDDNFDTIKELEDNHEWKIKAGFVAQRELQRTDRLQHAKSSNKRLLETDQENDRIKKKTKHEVTTRDKTQNRYEGATETKSEAIDAVEKGLRRSRRLNPELQKGEDLVAMLTELMPLENVKNSIEGEILAFSGDAHDNNPIDDPLAFKASTDPDIMYMHEAMKQKDKDKFIEAMEKEVADRMKNGNFTIVRKDTVPEDKAILPAVWQMRRKRDIQTRNIKKYKARLNIDGSRMEKGIHYDLTYAPIVSWNSICLLLILVAVHGWVTKQIDYVSAFPQAPVEKEIYMKRCQKVFR